MIKPTLRFLSPIVLLSILLFLVHALLVFLVLPPIYAESKFWLIYLFLVPLTLAAVYFIAVKYGKNAQSAGKNFYGYVIVKMILSLLFLSPWLFDKTDFSRPMVFQFFAVFFPLLFAETWILVKLIGGKK